MPSGVDIIGKTLPARVIRVEPYGLYLEWDSCDIVVLIPDVSDHPVDLENQSRPGDIVLVRVLRYIDEHQMYKGTLRDL